MPCLLQRRDVNNAAGASESPSGVRSPRLAVIGQLPQRSSVTGRGNAMTPLHCFGLMAASLLSIGVVCDAGEVPKNAITLETIVNAWKARQDNSKTLVAEWSGTQFEKLTEFAIKAEFGIDGELTQKPPANITCQFRRRLVLDQRNRVRLDYEGSIWSPRVNGPSPKISSTLFDGDVQKSLYTASEAEFPGLHIKKGTSAAVARNVHTLALRLIYRGFDDLLGPCNIAETTLANGQGLVDGRVCAIIKCKEAVVWIDAERDCLPIRYYQYRNGHPVRFLEVTYRESGTSQWVPVAWKDTRTTPGGEVLEAVTAKIAELRLNQPVTDDQFAMHLPRGTWVRNYVTNERYIDRGDGDKRPILDSEFDGKNYDELLNTDPPSQISRRVIAGFLVICIACSIGALWFWRNRSRRSANSA